MKRRRKKYSQAFWKWCNSSSSLQQSFGHCFRKNAYPTEEFALKVRDKCEKERPQTKLYTYQCPTCRKWHLTKQKPGEAKDEVPRVLGSEGSKDQAGQAQGSEAPEVCDAAVLELPGTPVEGSET